MEETQNCSLIYGEMQEPKSSSETIISQIFCGRSSGRAVPQDVESAELLTPSEWPWVPLHSRIRVKRITVFPLENAAAHGVLPWDPQSRRQPLTVTPRLGDGALCLIGEDVRGAEDVPGLCWWLNDSSGACGLLKYNWGTAALHLI